MAGFLLAASLQSFAFTEPSSTPPLGDAYAPLNTGPSVQDKADTTGHAAWITADGVGSRYGAVFASLAGNVGSGTTTPAVKLDVNGAIRVGETAAACTTSIVGALRWNGIGLEVCNGEAWGALVADTPATFLISGKNAQLCVDLGATVVDMADGKVCKFAAASCPSGWSQYQSYSTTNSNYCVSSTCPGVYYYNGTLYWYCTTGSHPWGSTAQEYCPYFNDTNPNDEQWCNGASTCYATITEIGCI